MIFRSGWLTGPVSVHLLAEKAEIYSAFLSTFSADTLNHRLYVVFTVHALSAEPIASACIA
jgi:hypothetical protein